MTRKGIGKVLPEKGFVPGPPGAEDDFDIDVWEPLPTLEEVVPAAACGVLRDDIEFLFGAGAGLDPVSRLESRIDRLARLLESKGLCGRHELAMALGVDRRGNA